MRRAVIAATIAILGAALAPPAGARTPHVLRVGSYKGIPGQFTSIQAAVNAAKPGDWVLVGPGDYKTSAFQQVPGRTDTPAAVLITTPNLYLRGMNRNTVVVDGTKPGTPQCSSAKSDQNFGPAGAGVAAPQGLNGILIWKAANVWVQNLTACNFLGGSGAAGNEIWWNGGDNSATIGGHGYYGSYLNATSTFYDPSNVNTGAQYGIFSSNWSGGTWDQTYASNFNDSGYYIGACQQMCNQTVSNAWAEFNALGYSGSNSGGSLLIENSQFDQNKDGFDTNSQNGDNPPPQDGGCPPGVKPPVAGAQTCWVFYKNYVHDNNNPNVPALGSASQGPVGTGMSVSGARNDTIMNNRFVNNGAWGVILVPYPDQGPPCTGGTPNFPLLGPGSCLYDEWGDAIINNQFSHNGGFGNPSNGDIGQFNFESGHPTNCYSGNTETGGGSLSPDAAALQQAHPKCDGSPTMANGSSNPAFLTEVLCDSQVVVSGTSPPCLPTDHYPRRTNVVMHPLPTSQLPTMPNVCSGAPVDPWCSGQVIKVKGCAAPSVRISLPLSSGERLRWVGVRMNGESTKYKARKRIRVAIGHKRDHRVRVRVTEHIKVGSSKETIRFTNVYKRC